MDHYVIVKLRQDGQEVVPHGLLIRLAVGPELVPHLSAVLYHQQANQVEQARVGYALDIEVDLGRSRGISGRLRT